MIKLTKDEIYQAKLIALEICRSNSKYDFLSSFGGIMAEIAAIKFFNHELGCTPPLQLNTEYINGCDGGYDFCFPDLVCKWDVKSSNKGYFEREHLRTKANFIIAVNRKEKGWFEIIGFISTSKIPNTEKIDFNCFTPFIIPRWLNNFPNRLKGRKDFIETRNFNAISDIIPKVLGDVEINTIIKK